MTTLETQTPTRTFTAIALNAELGRRKNNKSRDLKVRSRSFVLPALTSTQIDAIKAGEVVAVNFKSGRVEYVGLKS